jgi:hypothetical protein
MNVWTGILLKKTQSILFNKFKNSLIQNNRNIINNTNEDIVNQNKLDESEDKYYYDIPIKDFKKKTVYKETDNYFNQSKKNNFNYKEEESTNRQNGAEPEDKNKRKIIEEILRISNSNFLFEKDRPFTPPFSKLIPMSSLRSVSIEGKIGAILEKREENLPSEINFSPQKENDQRDFNKIQLQDSLEMNQSVKMENNHVDILYDHVLGCYYDPRTNIYYELKNNEN